MKVFLLLLSIVLWSFSALGQGVNPNDESVLENSDIFQSKTSEFAISLFRDIAQSYENQSFIFSPLDAQISLSMMGNLFMPDSSKSISKIFGCADISDLNSRNGKIISLLTDSAKSKYVISTKIANSIWFNTGVRHNKTGAIRRYYNAEIHHGTLSSPAEIKSINSWINKSTDGGINAPNFTVPTGTALIINSLLYFNQQWDWDYHFSRSYNGIFSSPKGPNDALFMDDEIEAKYFKNEIFESAILKLTRYHMICILPNNKDLNALSQKINADDINTIIENSDKRDIILTFPVFNLNSKLSLLPIFAKHGINPSKALASNIAITPQSIQLDQLSTIRVNQIGVAVGSVTTLCCVVSAPIIEDPIELKFNRPFMFFIIDPYTKTFLFAGQYTGPED